MKKIDITRTKETEQAYLITANRLLKRFSKETGKNVFNAPFLFTDWFCNLTKKLSSASIRQYKASLIFHLKTINAPLEVIQKIEEHSSKSIEEQPKRTSSKKNKKVNTKVLGYVIKKILQTNSKYSKFTCLFLVTNIYFGFRPKEWDSAIFLEDKNGIEVKNAKATNGRGNGEKRLVCYNSNHPSLKYAKELILELNKLKETAPWETIYEGSRKLLQIVQEEVEEQERITFYSTRHQLVANMKASGIKKDVMAMILGHGSIKTASIHYAKKKSGKKIKEEDIPFYHIDNLMKAIIT